MSKIFDETYVRCECFAEVMHVCRDRESNEVYISIYQPRGIGKLAWRWRLKHIWNIVRYGYPWQDEIILSEHDALEFGQWLTSTRKVDTTEQL